MTLSVLMVIPQFRPLIGGAERQAERLSTALAARGLRVRVLTLRLDRNTPLRESFAGVELERFDLLDLSRAAPSIRGLGVFNLPFVIRQVERAVAARLDGVDVVHGHIAGVFTAAALRAAAKKNIPFVCKAGTAGHGGDVEILRHQPGGRRLAQAMTRDVRRWVATTNAVEAALTGSGVPADRIATIPNGVELGRQSIQASIPGASRHFLYLGRLSRDADRDIPTLLAAFDRLAGANPGVQLALVGDGDRLDATRALADNCLARERIKVPGGGDATTWLDWADTFVLPSRYEGLSNALLEAMAAGLTCIANDIPANREVLGGTAGILVPVGDEDALLGALTEVASDDRYSAAWREAARSRISDKFSIDAAAAAHIEIYKALTAGDRP